MPSFDVVSKTDLAEVDNALNGIRREIAQRFDFKGSKCTIERADNALTILADDEMKLKQMHELLKVYMTRRKLDAGALEFKPPEKATGNARRQAVIVKQGLDAPEPREPGLTVSPIPLRGGAGVVVTYDGWTW